jgi:outer membrane lipoprotein SlyB
MNRYLLTALAFQIALVGCAATPKRTDTTYYRTPSQQPAYSPSQQSVYSQPSAQSEQNKKLLKNAVLGAATGAIAAEASGGKAGKGALIGAGTNVIGGALFDMLTAPRPQQQQVVQQNPQYAPYVDQWQQQNQGNKKIIRKYDSDGNIVSEEEVWQ